MTSNADCSMGRCLLYSNRDLLRINGLGPCPNVHSDHQNYILIVFENNPFVFNRKSHFQIGPAARVLRATARSAESTSDLFSHRMATQALSLATSFRCVLTLVSFD